MSIMVLALTTANLTGCDFSISINANKPQKETTVAIEPDKEVETTKQQEETSVEILAKPEKDMPETEVSVETTKTEGSIAESKETPYMSDMPLTGSVKKGTIKAAEGKMTDVDINNLNKDSAAIFINDY